MLTKDRYSKTFLVMLGSVLLSAYLYRNGKGNLAAAAIIPFIFSSGYRFADLRIGGFGTSICRLATTVILKLERTSTSSTRHFANVLLCPVLLFSLCNSALTMQQHFCFLLSSVVVLLFLLMAFSVPLPCNKQLLRLFFFYLL